MEAFKGMKDAHRQTLVQRLANVLGPRRRSGATMANATEKLQRPKNRLGTGFVAMTWLLILMIVVILVGLIWGLASRLGRGFDAKSKEEDPPRINDK